jgi:hypothetical protein
LIYYCCNYPALGGKREFSVRLNKNLSTAVLASVILCGLGNLIELQAQGRIASTTAQVRGRVNSNTTRPSGIPPRSSRTTPSKAPAATNKPAETKELSVSKRTVNGKEQVILESK